MRYVGLSEKETRIRRAAERAQTAKAGQNPQLKPRHHAADTEQGYPSTRSDPMSLCESGCQWAYLYSGDVGTTRPGNRRTATSAGEQGEQFAVNDSGNGARREHHRVPESCHIDYETQSTSAREETEAGEDAAVTGGGEWYRGIPMVEVDRTRTYQQQKWIIPGHTNGTGGSYWSIPMAGENNTG